MHKYLIYAAYGWLALSGTLHFVVDVVSQHLRGKRTASLETTLYYGLNSAFSLGQVAFGLLGLFLAWRHMGILNQTPVLALSLIAGMAGAYFLLHGLLGAQGQCRHLLRPDPRGHRYALIPTVL